MDCLVCLHRRTLKDEKSHVLRCVDAELYSVKEKLKGLEFSYRLTLEGLDLFFKEPCHKEKAKALLGDCVYSEGEPMEEVVGRLLRERGLTLSTAESCTAGLLSARVVNVAGSSYYFLGGVVVYSNRLKSELLGVREETIRRFGAVSEETCREMLSGLRERLKADCGVAITGIAGPGGSEKKPEGLTYIGVYLRERELVMERLFREGRNGNRFLSTQVALNLLRKMIEEAV